MYPQNQFHCLFNNKCTISSYFPFEDQIPLMVSSNIIYKYSCGPWTVSVHIYWYNQKTPHKQDL